MEANEFELRIADFIAECRLLAPGKGPVLVTLSGGADSVALLRVLVAMGYDCIAAHCNFHLRGAESDRDERFVVNLCQQQGVQLLVKHMDVPACQRERKLSIEMACRELRYEWFADLARECGCQAIAVAHHSDDNIETSFLNALRGSGIAGIAGMKPRNGNVVRPLLCVSRADVEQYLAALGQPYVVDSTNLENDYKRNRIRNVLLPAVEREFADARKCLLSTVNYVRDYTDLMSDMVNDIRQRVTEPCETGCRISIDGLNEVKTSKLALLIFEITKPYSASYDQCRNIAEIILNGNRNGQHFHTSTHTLSITSKHIVIEEIGYEDCGEVVVDFNDVSSLKVKLKLEHSHGVPFAPSMCDGKTVAAFSTSLLQCGRVVLRHWREGDRMRPFGMRGTKLLSDLFADGKLPPEARKKVWLLEADGEIVWVLGLRASAAYSVAKCSAEYILLTYCQ